MEVFDAVRTLLAVREYQDKPLPAETVRRIIEAGRLTGSSMNRQPWHFIVVESRDRLRQLGALAKTGPYIAQAALAIVVAIQRTPFSVSDGSRTIQSMMLTARSEGVGSNWVGFMGLATNTGGDVTHNHQMFLTAIVESIVCSTTSPPQYVQSA